MTIEEIKRSECTFLSAADIAPLLGCDPQSLREQVRRNPNALGFPVCRIGKRCRFPRDGFLQFLTGRSC